MIVHDHTQNVTVVEYTFKKTHIQTNKQKQQYFQ